MAQLADGCCFSTPHPPRQSTEACTRVCHCGKQNKYEGSTPVHHLPEVQDAAAAAASAAAAAAAPAASVAVSAAAAARIPRDHLHPKYHTPATFSPAASPLLLPA